MEPQLRDDARRALRDHVLADRRLGLTALPVRLPAAGGAPAPAPAKFEPIQAMEADAFEQRRVQLEVIDRDEVKPCTKCGLSETRTKTVFGVGSPGAKILFVGEAPGHDEDMQGEPFVGRAGRLLTDMIQTGMGLRREDVSICNILKCRPPNNRDPLPVEIDTCAPWLDRPLEILRPRLIATLAPFSIHPYFPDQAIRRIHGQPPQV